MAAVLVVSLARSATAADDVPEPARSAGYVGDDWSKLARGKVITRMASSHGNPPVSEGAGAFVIAMPWRHAFDQIGRIEDTPKYSSCLKAMEILMRAQRNGRTDVKARETHKTLWMTARYTLDYQEDLDRREIPVAARSRGAERRRPHEWVMALHPAGREPNIGDLSARRQLRACLAGRHRGLLRGPNVARLSRGRSRAGRAHTSARRSPLGASPPRTAVMAGAPMRCVTGAVTRRTTYARRSGSTGNGTERRTTGGR